jgi:cyclophilin family peptidyl-prolyl cis-trans isomerase
MALVAKPKGGRYKVNTAKGNLGWANPRVFFDFAVGDGEHPEQQRPLGRVVFELFRNEVPRTVENFRALCTGEKGMIGDGESGGGGGGFGGGGGSGSGSGAAAAAASGAGRPLHYKNSHVHRILPGFLVQAGDITRGTGAGGWSIYGESFAPENLHGNKHTHVGPGMLGMAHAGGADGGGGGDDGAGSSQNSQFYVVTVPAPHLDGLHTVFGKTVEGYDTVLALQALPVTAEGEPLEPVVIADCGQLMDGKV